jgi:hypothetical protein
LFFIKYDMTSFYAWQRIGEPRITVTELPDHSGWGDIAVDSASNVYLVNSDAQGTYFHVKPSRQNWLPTSLIDSASNSKPATAMDTNGRVHVAYEASLSSNHYQTSLPSSAASVSSISQTVMISPNLHHPTLSLLYQIEHQGSDSLSRFGLSISNGVTSTELFSVAANLKDWTHSWIDLEPWSGQMVTITLSAVAAHNFEHTFVRLDEVSLGSWLTPVISNVAPSQIEAHASTVITITGDNFIMTPTVRLNETAITAVVFVDERTLQVTVPDSLAPGRYDVWVVNPGGQESVLSRRLMVGKEVLLPIIKR